MTHRWKQAAPGRPRGPASVIPNGLSDLYSGEITPGEDIMDIRL